MVKLWRQDTHKGRCTGGEFTDEAMRELRHSGGNYLGNAPLSGHFPTLTIKITSRHAPNDFFWVGAMFVASDPLKELFHEFDVNAEYFHLNVIYQGKHYRKLTYFFVHLLDHVDCIDFHKSVFTHEDDIEEGYVALQKLVIDERKTAGFHLFRLGRTFQPIVCASMELAERVECSGLTGVECVPPSMFGIR